MLKKSLLTFNQLSIIFLIILMTFFFSGASSAEIDVKYGIDASKYGFSSSAADNTLALRKAIAEGERQGLPVFIPSSSEPYKISSNIVLKGNHSMLAGIGGNAHLEFNGASLVVGQRNAKNRGMTLRDLKVSRVGKPGPVIQLKNDKNRKHSRFTWNNIHIIHSTGDGFLVEGAFLGSITGLWVTDCEGTGIVFQPGNSEHSHNAGSNSIGFFGGEVKGSAWGIEAADTKGISFHGFAVEGNREGGVWLRGDNRNFAFYGGYFENNGKIYATNYEKRQPLKHPENSLYSDVLIGDSKWTGAGNRSIVFDGVFFSDGKGQHKGAVWILNNQKNIAFRSSLFNAYRASPIALESGSKNNSTGLITTSTNDRSDGRNIPLIKDKADEWTLSRVKNTL